MQTATLALTIDLSTAEGCAILARVAAALGAAAPTDPGVAMAPAVAEPAKAAVSGGRKNNKAAEVASAAPVAPPAASAAPAPVTTERDETMAEEAAREAAEAAAAAPPPMVFDRDAAVADVKLTVNAHVAKHGVPATSEIFKAFKADRLGDVKDDGIAGLKEALLASLAKPASSADFTA